MAQLLDSKDVMEFKELLLANTIQIDTIAEFLEKMKLVQADYNEC